MNLLDQIAEDLPFEESAFNNGKDRWSAPCLYEQAKKEKTKPYKFPLKFFDYSNRRYTFTNDVADVVFILKRIEKVDMSIPIIISPLGEVMDGYHRILKATMAGDKFIMAIRLKKMPQPIGKVEE